MIKTTKFSTCDWPTAPTCSCSSANRVARSSSESDDSSEDELLLLSEEAVLLLTSGVVDGTDTSRPSSGILAKRISNTSWAQADRFVLIAGRYSR